MPASRGVGTSGSAGERFSVFTASAVSLPSRMRGSTSATGPKKESARPAIASVMASGVPAHLPCPGCDAPAALAYYAAHFTGAAAKDK